MASLTQRDQRTIRIAAIAIAVYLTLFYGVRGWKHLEAARAEYQDLLGQATDLRIDLQRYENKVLLLEKLQHNSPLDLATLSRATVVGQASAAIQKAAQTSGVKLGPIRESAANPSAQELTSMQLEALGPTPAIMTLIQHLRTLGFPLVVDSMVIDADPKKPGALKVMLRLVILDFEQWKEEKRRHA